MCAMDDFIFFNQITNKTKVFFYVRAFNIISKRFPKTFHVRNYYIDIFFGIDVIKYFTYKIKIIFIYFYVSVIYSLSLSILLNFFHQCKLYSMFHSVSLVLPLTM